MRHLFLLRRKIRFFFQRCIRGWDDSETWCLRQYFYMWLRPRLKRFAEIMCAYPGNDEYPTFESWQTELNKRVKQLDYLIEDNDINFTDWSYIPKNRLKELKKKHDTLGINMIAYDYMAKDFHKWFAEHCANLWW